MVRVKRAYEPPEPGDGYRVLVDRLWPRGIRKSELILDAWEKDLAPSDGLRRWFGHDPARWNEFEVRYRHELRGGRAREILDELGQRARTGTVTLVYGAKDRRHNNALVLQAEIERRLQSERHTPAPM